MRSELTSKLKMTTRAEFVNAIYTTLDGYIKEVKAQGRELSQRDNEAIEYIRLQGESGISGESLREQLKTILRDCYGRVGRFFYDLPKRIEALRTHENFSATRLRWGDSPDVALKAQLAKSEAENQRLLAENQRLAAALKETTSDYVAALEKNEVLKEENLELRKFIKQSGLELPSHLQQPEVEAKSLISDKDKSWSWKAQQSSPTSPAIFKPEAVSEKSSPVISAGSLSSPGDGLPVLSLTKDA